MWRTIDRWITRFLARVCKAQYHRREAQLATGGWYPLAPGEHELLQYDAPESILRRQRLFFRYTDALDRTTTVIAHVWVIREVSTWRWWRWHGEKYCYWSQWCFDRPLGLWGMRQARLPLDYPTDDLKVLLGQAKRERLFCRYADNGLMLADLRLQGSNRPG